MKMLLQLLPKHVPTPPAGRMQEKRGKGRFFLKRTFSWGSGDGKPWAGDRSERGSSRPRSERGRRAPGTAASPAPTSPRPAWSRSPAPWSGSQGREPPLSEGQLTELIVQNVNR